MNSIKNAIVTITLLAVGYGSYIVLSEPRAGVEYVGQNSAADGSSNGEEVTALEIDQQFAAPQQSFQATPTPALSAPTESPSQAPVVTEPTRSAPSQLSLPDFADFPAPTTNATSTTRTEPPKLNMQAPAVTVSAPAVQGLPELPPLPDLIGSPETPTLSMPSSSNAKTYPEVDAVPELVFDETRPSSNPAPNQPEAVTKSRFEPAVAGPSQPASTANTLVPPVFQSNLGKAPPTLMAPKELESPVMDPAATVTAVLPPIDPSVGPIPPAPDEGSVAFERVWSEVQELVRNKDVVKALRILTPWSADTNLRGEQQDRCFRMLDELAGGVIYSRTSYIEPVYTVRAGETLEEIASSHGVPQELLARINGITAPYALSTGELLKVVRGPFRAEVSISNQRLTLYAGAYYAGRFQVAIGSDLPPEEAFYEVAEKSQGRTYFDRRIGSEVLRGQDNNRYGEHWLGLRGEHITSGHSVGIHGRPRQTNPGEVGCISLDPIDAGDVFSILSIGSRVQIRR